MELMLMLPTVPDVWHSLTERFEVDVLCHVKVRGVNQGFVIDPEVSSAVAKMGIPLGFDVFCDTDDAQSELPTRLANPE